jgi:hypothetical protein
VYSPEGSNGTAASKNKKEESIGFRTPWVWCKLADLDKQKTEKGGANEINE